MPVYESHSHSELATARSYISKAGKLLSAGRLADAIAVLQQILLIPESQSISALDHAVVCDSISAALTKLGRRQESSQWMRRAQALREPSAEETREKEHLQQSIEKDPVSMQTEVALLSYSIFLLGHGRSLEAVPLLENMLQIQRLREDHPREQAETCEWISYSLLRAGRTDEAEKWKQLAREVRCTGKDKPRIQSCIITPVARKASRGPVMFRAAV